MKVYSTTCTDEVCTTTCTDASAGGDGEILELLLPIFIIILPIIIIYYLFKNIGNYYREKKYEVSVHNRFEGSSKVSSSSSSGHCKSVKKNNYTNFDKFDYWAEIKKEENVPTNYNCWKEIRLKQEREAEEASDEFYKTCKRINSNSDFLQIL